MRERIVTQKTDSVLQIERKFYKMFQNLKKVTLLALMLAGLLKKNCYFRNSNFV